MKRVVVLCLALLAWPALAHAKEGPTAVAPVAAELCGADTCRSLPARALAAFAPRHQGVRTTQSLLAPDPAPFYELRLGYGARRPEFWQSSYVLPGAGLVRAHGDGAAYLRWSRLRAGQAVAVRAAARQLRPFPAPRLLRVEVDGRAVPEPERFVPLVGPLRTVPVPSYSGKLVAVTLAWSAASPWSEQGSIFNYLPHAHVLFRPDGFVAVPGDLAAALEREAAVRARR